MGDDSRRRWGWTLRQRLLAAIVLAATVVLGLRQVEMVQVRNLEHRHQELRAAHLEARLALQRLQAFYAGGLVFRWGHGVAEGRIAPGQALGELRQAWAEARADWQVALDARSFRERSAALFAPGSDRAAADAAEARLERILESGDRAALAAFLARDLEPAVARLDLQLREAADALRLDRPVLLQRLGEEVERQKSRLNTLLTLVFAGVVVVVALLFRGLDRDIARLAAHARRLSSRDFRTPLGEIPSGELHELGRAFVTMQDALLQYERELRNSEQLFHLASDLLCIAGTDGYFRRVNPAFEQALGYRAEDLVSRPFFEFIHPDDTDVTLAEVQKLSRGVPSIDFENRYRCRDGSYKWLNWRCQPAADGTLYAIARDMTEHKRLLRDLHEQKLEAHAASQAKSTFLASMSHEIRTPLIGVLGMLEVLGRSGLDREQRRQFEIVQQSASSLLEIVGDILDYSKIEAGKVELAPEPFSVRDLVSRVISTFSANAHSKGLQLVQDVTPAVAPAHLGDTVRIRQVLANFVGNAVKFTERGSIRVFVRVAEERSGAQRLVLSVADTGIGITAEQLTRLFQPFAQSDASITRRFGGTGLGLVICRRLADLMGGVVRAESELGQGTIMHLELLLPVADAAAAMAAAAMEEPVRTRQKPSREQAAREGSLLLLAEDHPINRKVLTDQIDLAGFVADTADTGTGALEKFRGGAYGLVLTDLHMPGLDGFQLTAAIREIEARHGMRRTPIIALTANVLRADVERTLASGMDDYLSKPVTVRQLTEKLRRWLPALGWGDDPVAPPRGQQPRRPAIVDESVLREAMGGNAGKARELLQAFCRTSAQDLVDFEAARGDKAAAGEVAHRIKGAALMVGAQEIALVAARIERAARHPRSSELTPLVEQLRQALARVEEYVRS